jgi:hypothetical protein
MTSSSYLDHISISSVEQLLFRESASQQSCNHFAITLAPDLELLSRVSQITLVQFGQESGMIEVSASAIESEIYEGIELVLIERNHD